MPAGCRLSARAHAEPRNVPGLVKCPQHGSPAGTFAFQRAERIAEGIYAWFLTMVLPFGLASEAESFSRMTEQRVKRRPI